MTWKPRVRHEPLDWRRISRYLSSDIEWMRERIALGDATSDLYTIAVVRSYLAADIVALRRSTGSGAR